MRSWKVLLPLAVAAVLALSALAVPASAAAPAAVPTWQVGQSVAYGTSLDLGSLANTYLSIIQENPAMFNITKINALNLTGSLDSWEVDQVTEKTTTYYTLASHSAEGLKLGLVVNVTMNGIPQPGTYQGTRVGTACVPPTVPVGSGTVSAELQGTSLSTTSGTSRLQLSNLAYINETQDATLVSKITFTGYHIPVPTLDNTTCTETVAYENPSFTLTADTSTQVRILNQPAWDVFNFPITDNKTWWANTTAVVGATLSGTVNVQGLSSQDETAFFDNVTKAFQSLGLTVTGLDAFPIDLSKISVLLGPSYIVNNGVVTDYPLPLHAEFRALASAMTLSDGNQYPVYLITNASYQCPGPTGLIPSVGYAAVYAPDFPAQGAGMIVGYELVACTSGQSLPVFQLTNTQPSVAQQKIAQTETTYAVAPPASTNTLADFFFASPYLGLILIAVVVIVVAAALILWRRRRTTSPPGGEPPAMPPPPSGPGNP